MARIASGTHETISLNKGDMTIFSSRQIRVMKQAIGRVQNNLIRQGVTIITDEMRPVHVSGHPARDEMSEMYGLVRTQNSDPCAWYGPSSGGACRAGKILSGATAIYSV